MMGALKRGTFSHQILNKNSLSLAHCVLNRSFMVCPVIQVRYNQCVLDNINIVFLILYKGY